MGITLSFPCDTTRCWDSTAQQSGFINELEENLDALRTELAELKDLSKDVMERVNIVEKKPHQVQGWLSRTETVINEADLLIEKSPQEINKLCMGGCCSMNPCSTYTFGKQIAKNLQKVKNQKQKSNEVLNMVADKVPIPLATDRRSERTVGLESTFNEVWSSLREEQVGIIGLYGLGGVGKTTLLTQIKKFLNRRNDFDHVIWAVASQDLQLEKVQEEIGKSIGILDEAWKSRRLDEKAVDIFCVFCEKKFALLLDDIWEQIDLTRVGLPLPTQENGSKIIFTTRFHDVCCQMGAHKIKVKSLPQGEALKLFEEKVGAETLDKHPDIRKLAREVAEECAGLPLALITVGRAMASKKTPEEWKYAIEVLRQSTASVFSGVEKEMYPKLKFSYDCLLDERVKSCFLYCALYPEDFRIEKRELIDYWIGEGFLDEHTNWSSVRNQGHYIIGSLIDACLLEEEWNLYVKMHDVIRDMALWIAGESDKEKFFVKARIRLKKQPVAEKWEKVGRVSLMKNQIENLTEILACPNLQTLFLGSNKLKVINNDFFRFMPTLRVLDLSLNRNLKELPVGISSLFSLEHLNLSYTGIRKLPVELKALEKLKYLNLEYTWHLKMIPQLLISSFSKLQVLKTVGCAFGSTDTTLEDKTAFGNDEWVVEEMESLKYLNVLTIIFRSASMFERALGSYKFQSYVVEAVWLQYFRGTRLLNIMALANMWHLEFLELIDCEDLEEVKMEITGIASAESFRSLREVHLLT